MAGRTRNDAALTVSAAPERFGGAIAVRAAIALVVAMFVLFVVVLSFSMLRQWTDAHRRAEDRASAASQVVATNAKWISELSRQALARIDDALGPEMENNAAATADLIREAVQRLPGNVKSYVVAADGRTLFSTDPNVRPVDVRDRDYFSALAKGAPWYVSPLLVSRLDGSQIFVFSKRLERNRDFAGAAIISFDVALLRDIWESLDLDERSTVSFIRSDGQLVARYPFSAGPLDLSGYVLFTDYLKKADAGTYPALSPADGISRIVGYRVVPETDLLALASISTSSALSLFWRSTIVTLVFAIPTAIALAIAIVWIFRLLKKDERRRRELMEALELNRMLVRDTHHRVKNNLQAIISMVRMHPLPAELKEDLQSRISAMSSVHEHLYRLDKFAEIDAATLIPDIVERLRDSFAAPVATHYELKPLLLDRDTATPLALLVSEVATNSLKYAFPGGRQGTLRIALAPRADGDLELTIADDGVGFEAGGTGQGLGSKLIRAMVLQLGGSGGYVPAGAGTTFSAILPRRIALDAAPHHPTAAAAE